MVLETKRFALRLTAESDLDFLASMLGNPEVMHHYPKPLDREESKGWLQRTLGCYAKAGHGFWIVERRENGERVGQVGLLPKEINGKPEVEVAYMVHRDYWKQGIASETALACRDYAFNTLKVSRIISMIRPANHVSLRVAKKLDMQLIGEAVHLGLHHDLYENRRKTGL